MKIPVPSGEFYTEYDARLVEEAVMLRVAGHPEEGRFRRARNRIYDLADGEERENQFQALHGDWFRRLQLGGPIMAALEEQPNMLRATRFCWVIPAASAQDEGVDLHEIRDGAGADGKTNRALLVKLRPSALLDAARLRTFLRHEFMHVADMLDPPFGYEPLLPKSELGPAYDNLVRERYRVLWDTCIDGRLLRKGWAAEGVREERLAEFTATFATWGQEAQEKFFEFFDAPSPTHAGLMAFALRPGAPVDRARAGKPIAQPCPLCRFPSFDMVDSATELPVDVVAEIVDEFPAWRPEYGVCRQCADLYRAREMSRSAERTLPRV